MDLSPDERWSPPSIGEWKINCNASFKNGRAALGLVVRDDCGTLIEATAKIYFCKSAFEAELKVVEWATSIAAERK